MSLAEIRSPLDAIQGLEDMYARATGSSGLEEPGALKLENLVERNVIPTKTGVYSRIAALFEKTNTKALDEATSPHSAADKKVCQNRRIALQKMADLAWHSSLFKLLTSDQRSHIVEARATLEKNPVNKLFIFIQHTFCRIRDFIYGTQGLSIEMRDHFLKNLVFFEKNVGYFNQPVVEIDKGVTIVVTDTPAATVEATANYVITHQGAATKKRIEMPQLNYLQDSDTPDQVKALSRYIKSILQELAKGVPANPPESALDELTSDLFKKVF